MDQNILSKYLTQDSKTFASLLSKLKQLNQWNAWLAESLGPDQNLTDHCSIVGMDRKSLIVIADTSHWVTRFRFHIPELLNKLRKYPELQTVQAICCKVRPQNYSRPVPEKKVPTISHNSAESLRCAASKIEDKKLKAILEKIAARADEPTL